MLDVSRILRASLSSTWCLTLLSALTTGCGESTPDKPSTLSFVHVEDGRLVDASNRHVLLRGINARIEGIFDVSFSDGRERLEPIPSFTHEDAEAMAAIGFNLLRLPINWSGIEPEEGQFDETYLERIDEVVEHCRNAGIYVLLDYHQDAYSKEIGEDGAPYWAILPEPEHYLEGPLENLHERRASSQVLKAFSSFFDNVDNLRDRFLPAVGLVAARYADDTTVIGYEIMNEPVALHVPDSLDKLYSFYEQVTATLREHDTMHTIWMEPDASRNFLYTSDIRTRPFPDDKVVYTPHMYPSFEGSGEFDVAAWREALSQTYEWMDDEGKSWGGATAIGEWGTNPRRESSQAYIRASHSIFNEYLFGQCFWLWKEHTQGYWGLYEWQADSATWSLNELAAKEVGQPTAHAVPGTIQALSFNPDQVMLEVQIETDSSGWAQIFAPQRWFGDSPTVTLDGDAVEAEAYAPEQYLVLIPEGSHTLRVQ